LRRPKFFTISGGKDSGEDRNGGEVAAPPYLKYIRAL
jgi:hypothetical protein